MRAEEFTKASKGASHPPIFKLVQCLKDQPILSQLTKWTILSRKRGSSWEELHIFSSTITRNDYKVLIIWLLYGVFAKNSILPLEILTDLKIYGFWVGFTRRQLFLTEFKEICMACNDKPTYVILMCYKE